MIDEWDLTSTNLGRAAGRRYEVAVLPTCAIEPHNRHLPEGQDWRETSWIARECCRRAWEQTQNVLCLPALPYGVDCNLLEFPLAVHVSQNTLNAMVAEIFTSLRAHGLRKFVILNGHGGNEFMPLVREIQCRHDFFVFLCNWWTVGNDKYKEIFEAPDDHAGELETSVALALYPELVERESAGDGQVRPFAFEALRKGWVRTSRRLSLLNDHCAVGDPSKASADKGRKYLEIVCGRVSAFLVDLARRPIDAGFPFEAKK